MLLYDELMKRSLLAVLVVGLVATSTHASSAFDPRFTAAASPVVTYDFQTGQGPEVLGEPAEISLVNNSTAPITMGETWDLEYLDGDGSAFYQWPEEELVLQPGEARVWTWDQRVNQCYGECVNVREGDPAPAGRYEVTTTVNGEEETVRFTLGQLFTLGFEARPSIEFTVFVGSQPEIDQMTAEAEAEDKTLIVSGLVRKGRTYNMEWKFSMGPHSIELGEVFIEVCDGSPFYIQRHREEWLGERWCPWDSYVKRVGA